ncbi:MAG: phage tail protein, partial [Plesiomonas shigelloides]
MGIEIAILGVTVSLATAVSVAMAALSVAMVLTMKKPSLGSGGRGQAERKQVLRSAAAPEDWVYGLTIKSGVLAFAEEEKGGWQDTTPDPETNQGYVEWLHQVLTIAGHPIDRIGRIWFNDDEIQTFGANASYELLNSSLTANEFLLENCPSWNDDMIGRGIASLRVSMLFNQRLYPAGIPNVKLEVWGRQIFDPRDNQTKWSDNASLIMLDFVRNHPKFRIKDSRIDWDSFKLAANICDEVLTRPDGKKEKRYTINGSFDLNERPSSILDDMLISMAGELTWFGGKIGVIAGAYYGPATQVVHSGDILGDLDITPESAAKDRINTINGTFVDPDQLHVETDFPPVIVNEWVTEDGEERNEDLKLRFVTSDYQAQRLANIKLRRARLGRTMSFQMNLKGYEIRPSSYIQLKVPEIEMDQEFRVVEWEHDPIAGTVTLTVRQDGVAIWDDAIGKPMDRPPLVNLPSGGPAVPSDLKFQVETIGEVVQGVLTWRNSAMTSCTNVVIKRDNLVIYTAQEPRNIHRLGGLPVGNYVAELRAIGMAGGMSDKATINFTVATPAAVQAVDIRAANWDITLTPRLSTTSTYGTEFEFFYYRTPLQPSQVETTAQRLGFGAQLTHSGLQT